MPMTNIAIAMTTTTIVGTIAVRVLTGSTAKKEPRYLAGFVFTARGA
jgi:hypothetical protein